MLTLAFNLRLCSLDIWHVYLQASVLKPATLFEPRAELTRMCDAASGAIDADRPTIKQHMSMTHDCLTTNDPTVNTGPRNFGTSD